MSLTKEALRPPPDHSPSIQPGDPPGTKDLRRCLVHLIFQSGIDIHELVSLSRTHGNERIKIVSIEPAGMDQQSLDSQVIFHDPANTWYQLILSDDHHLPCLHEAASCHPAHVDATGEPARIPFHLVLPCFLPLVHQHSYFPAEDIVHCDPDVTGD